MTGWPVGLLVVAYTLAVFVQGFVDSRRDIAAPYRRVDHLPEPGPDAWVAQGASRVGVWGGLPAARLVVTEDWIGLRIRTFFSGVRIYVVDRSDVSAVATVSLTSFPAAGVGVGVIGRDGPSGLLVRPFTNREAAEAHLDRLGWPHVRRRPRLLRPFA